MKYNIFEEEDIYLAQKTVINDNTGYWQLGLFCVVDV